MGTEKGEFKRKHEDSDEEDEPVTKTRIAVGLFYNIKILVI